MRKMKVLQWIGPEKIAINLIDIPKIDSESVLLKVDSCAICGSDLRTFYHGNSRIKAPKILGHEVAGEIVEMGAEVKNFVIGDRISIGADIPCGLCHYCKIGSPNNCEANMAIGYQYEGGFAQYMVLDKCILQGGPVKKFHHTLDPDIACLGEPLACAINGLEIGMMKPGKSVGVIGAGPMGIMLAELCFREGASIVFVLDMDEKRLAFASEFSKDFKLFSMAEESYKKKIKELTDGRGLDLVFTACASRDAQIEAVNLLGKRGVLNFFGGLPQTAEPLLISSNYIHYNEIVLTGSHGSTPEQHNRAIEMLESKKINFDKLVTHRFSLDDGEVAFRTALNKDGMKVIINPNGK